MKPLYSLICHADNHARPIELPHLPDLRFLTLTAEVKRLRIPQGILEVIVTLPKCTPLLEVLTVVVDAEFEEPYFTSDRANSKVDAALKSLPRLQKVHFIVTSI